MKKILLVIFAAVITLTFSACSQQLSEQEYADKLLATYRTYVSELQDMAFKQMNKAQTDEILGAIDRASSALDEIERMNPPALYSAQHRSLCEAMPNQRSELAVNKRIAVKGESEELLKELEENASVTDFHEQMLSIVKLLKTDGYLG